jgi:uncharacterized protein
MHYPVEEGPSLDELLEDYICAIVSVPHEVEIDRVETETTIIYTIDVVPDDRGKIIGKGGSIINSLKTIFRALGCKYGKKVHLEIRE